MLQRVCMYCRKTLGWIAGDDGITSGICASCNDIVHAEIDAGGNCDPDDIRAIADLRLPACQRSGGM